MYNIFHCSFLLSGVYSHRITAEAEYIAEYISINWTEAWNCDDLVMGAAIFYFYFLLVTSRHVGCGEPLKQGGLVSVVTYL